MITKLTLLFILALSGCAATPLANAQPNPPAQIILDGDLSDWQDQTGARADNDELFIAFDSYDPSQAIQAADFTTRIRIDTDHNITTGKRQMYQAEQGLTLAQGVDLTINISPPSKNLGKLRGGASLTTHTSYSTKSISHADAGFYFLPTHNAPRYEARIDRTLIPSLQHNNQISIVIEHLAIGGSILKTQSFTTTLPPYKPSPPINDPITPKPTDSLRIMSTNVLFSSPLKNPEPFVRVLDALNPDVILYQEWFKTTEKDVRQWFDDNLDNNWTQSIIDPSSGVAIVTHLPIIEGGLQTISNPNARRPRNIAIAVLDAKQPGKTNNDTKPLPLIVVSIHLKCCGGANSDEDAKRIAQAHKINTIIQKLRNKYPNAGLVIGGDYNLVGSRAPLDIIAQDLGINNQNLIPAPTKVLGTQSMLTWTDTDSPYTPGRLDWILVDNHAWTLTNSWSLDTARLSDQTLKQSGLKHNDSRATDHLPIIVDLTPPN